MMYQVHVIWISIKSVDRLMYMYLIQLLSLCVGMERLCVCSADGKLHFYQLCEDTPVMSDSGSLLDVPNGLCNGETPVEAESSTSIADSSESRENLDRNSPGNVQLKYYNLHIFH